MTAYYNEFDPKAAAWLRELIKQGHIADGVVDERSITNVRPEDLAGFTQCHFFAGIGGWSYALRLAGIPDDYPCWTGSPPCQPFSVAGRHLGQLDERHLAPTFMRLVEQCQPPILFGEQVAAAIGKHWLDDLFTELERQGYACGAAVLPACSIGAPHKRDRIFFGSIKELANANSEQWHRAGGVRAPRRNESSDSGLCNSMANPDCGRVVGREGAEKGGNCNRETTQREKGLNGLLRSRKADLNRVANTNNNRQFTDSRGGQNYRNEPRNNSWRCCSTNRQAYPNYSGNWSYPDWLGGRDGYFRPVEPGTFPLANGISARVGRLRGYGNAIVPQVAAEFIGAFLDSLAEMPCTACGFPATDNQLCDTCGELYSAKSPNFYDLGGDDENNNSSGEEN
ncbi:MULTISPECIES: DNA cytosine methyltransferase [unclassified Tatumella]|uniref:DNA cytosine methyltransferase n=1 Tax=unclassified Tatumella TaxID=2649542 RepID=UPI001BAF50DB|nr:MULTISPECIES: DNA cytosine methyltransferase [unclassified Tatumella]MBS0854970.1 DNA cytosine methyltransferase [Tatumella sp. JGM16]MBS0912069.1 DNA cytosine methyltransferase [Tatumella sp. JGM91]